MAQSISGRVRERVSKQFGRDAKAEPRRLYG